MLRTLRVPFSISFNFLVEKSHYETLTRDTLKCTTTRNRKHFVIYSDNSSDQHGASLSSPIRLFVSVNHPLRKHSARQKQR